MKKIKLLFLFIFIISCQGDEGGSSSSGDKSGAKVTKSKFKIDILSHSENNVIDYSDVFFDIVYGKFSTKSFNGHLTVKWIVSSEGKVSSTGIGGFVSSEWNDGTFVGTWSAISIKLVNKKMNRIAISVSDSLGTVIEKSILVNCDIPGPELVLTSPSMPLVWVKSKKGNLSGDLDTDVNVSVFDIINDTKNVKTALSIQENWSGVIDLDDGLNSIRIKVVDEAGAVDELATIIGSDTTPPVISYTSPSTSNTFVTSSLADFSLQGNATDPQSGLNSISWENEANGSTGSALGLSTWDTGSISVVDGFNSIIITANDNVFSEKLYYFDYIVDRTPPEVLDSSFRINDGAETTSSTSVLIDLTISDSLSRVEKVCFKYNDTIAPSAIDSCWSSISTPAKNVNLENIPFSLGATSMPYKVYAWAMDEVGNISVLSNDLKGTGDKDLATIRYVPGPAASINAFYGGYSDLMTFPPKPSETQGSQNTDIYIKWHVSDDFPIPAGAISLEYTIDDVNYVPIASGLNNSAGAGCTVDGNYTGCYRWVNGSPTDDYFKLRIKILDSTSILSIGDSNSLNIGSLNLITGNTNLGLNGSAMNSIFFTYGEGNYNDAADPGAFVVTESGFVFIRDEKQGLLYIDPADGNVRQLARETGNYSGDGGSVFDATFKRLSYLTLDFDDNLIVWDGSRVRKIDLSTTPWSVDILMGSGSDTSDGALATNASITYRSSSELVLTPTPNGRIYFQKTKYDIWYYEPATKTIHKKLNFSGLGTSDLVGPRATYDNGLCRLSHFGIGYDVGTYEIDSIISRAYRGSEAYCGAGGPSNSQTSFDPVTGVATAPHPTGYASWSAYKYTGMDGKIYLLEHGRDQLNLYNKVTRNWDYVMGKVSKPGRCPDGTAKEECNFKLMSLFVNKNSEIYFMDMGVIRYIDSNGKVQTLAGQPRNFGVGASPLFARYAQINFFTVANNNLYIKDALEQQIVSIPLGGGNVEHIAGSGVKADPVVGSDARTEPINNCGWSMSCGIQVDEGTNKLYHKRGNNIAALDLINFTWSDVISNGSSQVSFLGKDNLDRFIYYSNSHNGSLGDLTQLKVLNTTVPSITKIYGSDDRGKVASALICDDGSVGTDCLIGYSHNNTIQSQYKFNPNTNSWLIFKRNTNTIHSIPRDGGVVAKIADLSSNASAFEYRRSGSDDVIYYCSSIGKLFKKNLTSLIETEIDIGVSSIKCYGNSLHYDSNRDSLMFIYQQNSLFGIAEIAGPGI